MTVTINSLLSSIVSLDRWFSPQLICINILFIARKTDLRGHLASNCFHCFYWTRMTDLASLGKEIEMTKRGLRIFSLSHALDKIKNIFLYFFTELKNLPSLLFLSTNITLSTLLILAVCRTRVMNLVIDLAHCRVTVTQWLQHLSAKSEGLRFSSSWGLNFFFVPRSWRDEIKSFSIECLSWKLNWPIWLVRYQDDYFFPIWRYFAYAWTYFN